MGNPRIVAAGSFLLLLSACSTGLRPASGSASDAAVARAEEPPAPVPNAEEPPPEEAPVPRVVAPAPAPPPPPVVDPMTTGPRAVQMLPPMVGTVPQAPVYPLAGGCCPPPPGPVCCPPCRRDCDLYAGVSAEFSPGVGGGLHVGRVFHTDPCAEWSWEVGLSYHDLWEDVIDEGDTGKSMQVRAGLKASFTPSSRAHFVARGGLTYYQITGEGVDEDWLEVRQGDYVGLFGSVGYEWDVSCRFTTGPEVGVSVVTEVEDFDVEFVPFARWNFILRL